MKRIAISLISIVTLSMMLMAVAPVFAGKPVAAAHAQLQQDVFSPNNFQVDIFNDGGVAIVKVHLVVSSAVVVSGWGAQTGWTTTGSVNDLTFWAKGRAVIRNGESASMLFNVEALNAFTVTWTAYDRKDNTVGSGTLVYPIPT